MLFNVPVAVLGGGFAAPAAFLVATIVLTIFAVGYIEMARTVTAAGGFYSFVTHGFGTVMGMGTAALISLCYVIFCSAVLGVDGILRVDERQRVVQHRHPGVGVHACVPGDHQRRCRLVPHRAHVEDPWRLPRH